MNNRDKHILGGVKNPTLNNLLVEVRRLRKHLDVIEKSIEIMIIKNS